MCAAELFSSLEPTVFIWAYCIQEVIWGHVSTQSVATFSTSAFVHWGTAVKD